MRRPEPRGERDEEYELTQRRLHQFASEPTDGWLDTPGPRLHYLEWGAPVADRPTVLLLHGWGLTAHTWDVVCDVLDEELYLIALDLRGHGDSDWSPDHSYPLSDHVADLDALIAARGPERFVVVGMSLGGLIALDFAARHPEGLAGIVLVDSGPRFRQEGGDRIRRFMAGPAEADSIDEFIDRAIAFNPVRQKDQLSRSLRYNLRQTPDGRWRWKYDPVLATPPAPEDEHSRVERERTEQHLWEAARRISCPTLVVRGGESDCFFDEDAEELAHVIRRGRWVRIAGAGHTVQGDRPYELAATLRGFFAEDIAGHR